MQPPETDNRDIVAILVADPKCQGIIKQLNEEEAARREKWAEGEEHMQRVRERIADEKKALADAAGITMEEYEDLVRRGIQGVQALNLLIGGQAGSPEEALTQVRIAADREKREGDEHHHHLMKITGERIYHPLQPPTEWEILKKEMADHEAPRRRRGKSKGRVGRLYQNWKERQDQQTRLDQEFEKMLREHRA
ncbi:hypothetical protein KKB64_01900 [Patescibacteria group bacterium]|nr:hypothetical protein [Patescibacteria group bacterium]MBU1472525.1 hypothetical protein [Patescibacteria group bacterium]MBU2460102.1 hypothetical protein [Patescibacteria group bacterium]MBU2544671.1 hypothetical protein [Patescibacteria group bacterium]